MINSLNLTPIIDRRSGGGYVHHNFIVVGFFRETDLGSITPENSLRAVVKTPDDESGYSWTTPVRRHNGRLTVEIW